ncbi:MAG: metal-dependent transcriptional regulator [Sedimentisphaerales bacterium]|nr:metal-dependent transcriptional regulator [Sedimentisphaerales bacterium]
MAVRKNYNLSPSMEDYLEAILNVADPSGIARSRDIAATLEVAKPSVTGALRQLAKKGLVNYKPYGCVTLTTSGAVLAMKVAKKHDIIKSFLTEILGVDGPAAQDAACKAEHLLDVSIVSKMSHFTNFAKTRAKKGEDIMHLLKRFSAAGRAGK